MPERPSPAASQRITPVGNPESRGDAKRGTVIAVYGTRADTGVPVVAAALASAVRRLVTDDVVFAELESRPSRARKRPRTTPRASRTEEDTSVEQIVIPGTEAALVRRSDGVWMLAIARGRGAGVGDAKSVITALDAMRDRFPVSVTELGHQLSERTLAAFDAADRILLVTEGSVTSLRGVQRVLQLCRRLNYPDEKLCVVAKPTASPGSLAPADISAVLKRELFWRIPLGDSVDVDGLAAKLLDLSSLA